MYKEYFGLKETPFSIAPDPRYLFMSIGHREALAHLVYGINGDSGFVLLTGEVGTGKTTICRCLLEQMPDNSDIAFVLNPKVTVQELLATVCDELGVRYPEGNSSIKVFVDAINAHLLDAHARGKKTILIIEEAQNLGTEVLEQVRLLTNLETNETKLLQIIMIGQPELREMLARKELRQLAQRITARYHLGPLSQKEVAAYVTHRLAVAGVANRIFPAGVIKRLYQISEGIPRLINVLCDRALLGAYVQGKAGVDRSTFERAAEEVLGRAKSKRYLLKRYGRLTGGLLILVLGVVLAAPLYEHNRSINPKKLPVTPVIVKEKTAEVSSMDTLQWPADLPLAHSKEMAYQALFEQWNLPYYQEGHGSACQQAEVNGLRCLHRQGSLNSLRLLNRPAVLKLFDDQGREYYAALTSLRTKTATFVFGPETKTVDVKAIALKWFGDYTLLWRIPPQYGRDMRPGSKGPAVRWLEKQLSTVRGKEVPARENIVFDETLVKSVKQFQHSEGLAPDGIVGPETVILLNTVAGSGEPVLTAAKKER